MTSEERIEAMNNILRRQRENMATEWEEWAEIALDEDDKRRCLEKAAKIRTRPLPGEREHDPADT